MFRRLQNSWELVKASIDVLKADKELMLFPVVSAITLILVTASFVAPLFLTNVLESIGDEETLGLVHYVVLFLFYFVQYFVIIFFNSALIGAALIRLRGGDPTVGDGFRIAFSHLSVIAGYAAISATVGLILRALTERGKLGEFVASLIGVAWNIAVFLAVPILVNEDVGPIEAIRRSSRLLKKTWGEQIAGNLGIGIIFFFIYLLIIIAGVGLVYLAVTVGSVPFMITSGVIVFLVLLLTVLMQSTVSGIYVAAVYQYAVEGDAGAFFDESLVQNAFRAS